MFNDHRPGNELDDTAQSAANDRLEEILRRVKAAGAEINLDERTPLFIDFNNAEEHIGDRRVVEFNLNKTDFQITQDIKNMRVSGAGHHKHLEKMPRPMVELKLRRKPESSDQWLSVDIEDMF